MNRLKAIEPTADFDVTYKTLSLGDANATTKHYAESYSAGTTIEMPIFTKATQQALTGTGFYVRRDALGFTMTSVADSGTITQGSNVYLIMGVKPHQVGDQLAVYEVDLCYLPLGVM